VKLFNQILSNPIFRTRIRKIYGRSFYWSWAKWIGKKKILSPYIDPLDLVVKEAFPSSVQNYIFGLEDFSEMGFLMHFLRKDDFFVDIGANIGAYSLLAAGVSEAFVLSFEPDDARRDFLKEQVMVNGLHPLIYIDSRVVGTKEETLIFSEHSVSKNIYVEAGVPRIAVSIDSLELEKTPNMVKIDAKGYGLEVIQGMRQLLEHEDMKAVICSFSEDIEPEIRDLTREIIRSEGFKVCSYNPVSRVLEESEALDKELMLFVRDLDFARQRLALAKSFSWFNKQI